MSYSRLGLKPIFKRKFLSLEMILQVSHHETVQKISAGGCMWGPESGCVLTRSIWMRWASLSMLRGDIFVGGRMYIPVDVLAAFLGGQKLLWRFSRWRAA